MVSPHLESSAVRSFELPTSEEAESAVCGSIIKSPSALAEVVDMLPAAAFMNRRYRDIYNAAVRLHAKQVPIEIITLTNELVAMKSMATMMDMVQIDLAIASAAHIKHYAGIIVELDVRRRGIEAAQRAAEYFWNRDVPLDVALTRTHAGFEAAAARADEDGDYATSAKDEAEALADEVLHGTKLLTRGVETPWRSLNRLILGLAKKNVYYQAARTQVGKSIIIEQLAIHAAQTHGPVYLVSLEMSVRKLVDRAVAMMTGVPRRRLLVRDLHDWERPEVAAQAREFGKLSEERIRIWSGPSSIERVAASIARYQAEVGQISLVLIDYVQLLNSEHRFGTREQEVAHVSREIKRLADRLDVPVWAAVQVNRDASMRKSMMPALHDLRESGSLEQDADCVIALHRDDPNAPGDKAEFPGKALMMLLKDRDTGNAGARVYLDWNERGEFYSDGARGRAFGTASLVQEAT